MAEEGGKGAAPMPKAASMARARKASGLTHAGMASRIGVSERTYRLMEAGIEPVRPSHAETFRRVMAASEGGRAGTSPSSRNSVRSRNDDGRGPVSSSVEDCEREDGIAALVARRKGLASEVERLKAALAQAKAGLVEVGLAIREKRNELRAAKVVATCEPTPQSMGGHARSLSMTPEERSDIASRAAKARWEKQRKSGG